MKERLSSVAVVLISAIIMCAGCSVKEDRGGCPCRLVFDFSGVGCDVSHGLSLSVTSADGFLFHGHVGSGDTAGYAVDVPRRLLDVNVWHGDEGHFDPSSGCIVPEGEQFPPLYLFSAGIDARKEYCICRPVLYKSYCTITIEFRHEEQDIPFSFRIAGDVAGYDITGFPAAGAFSYFPEPDGSGSCSVRVPRQKDNSLRLEVIEDGNLLRVFALGEIIAASGYDRTTDNLRDVTVEIDYSKTDVIFTIEGWKQEFSFVVTI